MGTPGVRGLDWAIMGCGLGMGLGMGTDLDGDAELGETTGSPGWAELDGLPPDGLLKGAGLDGAELDR